MKKLLFCLVLLMTVLAPLTVSAEYVTFYDILKDAKTLAGDSIDSLWEKTSEEAKAAVEGLYGYKCGEAEDNVIACTQKHWTGDYTIKLFITAEDKLEAVDFILTSDSLRTLNYKRNGKSEVHQANDFYSRMENEKFFDSAYNLEEGTDMIPCILPNKETIPFIPAVQADADSFIQLAYNVISDTNPEFTLEFVFTSRDYAMTNARSFDFANFQEAE